MIRFISLLLFFCFGLFSQASDFFDLKPNNKYNNDSIDLNFLPFHANKTQIYVDSKGGKFWEYKYGNSHRERYVYYKDKKLLANVPEKYGTINNFLVLYHPELDHIYDTYWPMDAKIGDAWKAKILHFNVDAKLSEFGDMIFDNKKIKYAKIDFVDLKSNKEGYALFGENVGLIEFKLGYRYIRLKSSN